MKPDDVVSVTLQTFDETAEEYAKKTDNLLQTGLIEKFVSDLKSGSLILDLGCGPGRDAEIFIQKGYQVIGVDGSKAMVDLAKKRVPVADFRVMDLRGLNFPDNYFAGVWASASLHFLPKLELSTALKEIYRVAKPDSPIFISVKLGQSEGLEKDHRYGDKQKYYAYYSVEEFVDKIELAGFKKIKSAVDNGNIGYSLHGFINVFCRK